MKAIFLSSIFIILLGFNCLHGQTINYTYDENGNRTSRVLVTEQLRSNNLQFPILNPKELPKESMKESKKESLTEIITEGELATYVYPNPNMGIIKIDITYLPLNAKTEARVYDLSGTERLVKRNFESHSEIDISQLKEGIYILRIKINDKIFDWKVIKGNR